VQDLATKAADGDGESQIAVTEEELKELNYQRELASKNTEQHYEKFTAWESERKRKIDQMRQEKADPEEESCTFKPSVNRKAGEKRRSKQ